MGFARTTLANTTSCSAMRHEEPRLEATLAGFDLRSPRDGPSAGVTAANVPPKKRAGWRRYGCAWQTSELATTQRKKSITAGRERLRRRSPWQVGPRLGPCPPLCCGVARFWRLAPAGGIPAQICGIRLLFPCRNNRPLNRPFLVHGRHADWNRFSHEASRR